jgi:hypothetical protein
MSITAKYDGHCEACGGRIKKGTRVTWDRASRSISHLDGDCPARPAQSPAPKVAPGTILNGPVIHRPTTERLADDAAAKLLAEIGSEFSRPLPTGLPTIGLGYEVEVEAKKISIGTCSTWVGMATDWSVEPPIEHIVSLIDGAVLETGEYRKTKGLNYWTRQLGAPLTQEAGGKYSATLGEIQQDHGRWYIVTAIHKPYYMSAEDADDMDMFDRGGGWATPFEMREITEPKAEREAREAKEAATRDQAAQIIAQVTEARAKVAELLPLGIRPLTSAEFDLAWASIHKWEKTRDGRPVEKAEKIAANPVPEELGDAVAGLVRAALGNMWGRLPAMPGNTEGALGWQAIYQVGDRLVVYFVQTGYDSGGPTLQGISVLPEDADLLADQANRRGIRGYRFEANLYATMVALDAEGKLSKYGKGSYFGGTPSLCRDLPEAERACTKGAYSRFDNQTAAEVRADLAERFRGMDDPRAAEAMAILEAEGSISEIRL